MMEYTSYELSHRSGWVLVLIGGTYARAVAIARYLGCDEVEAVR